jgi:hypothetical protein
MRWSGGERGLGRETISLRKPVKKTPSARM